MTSEFLPGAPAPRSDEIDRVIDDVAQEMTAGDASANLRARVVDAIDRPRRFRWRLLVATACAASAVALAAIAIKAPRGGVAPDVPGPSPKVPELSLNSQAPSNVPGPSLEVPAIANVREAVSASNPFSEAPLIEDPIVLESIAAAPMAPADPIAVEPLPSIAPIAVTPLDAQGEPK